MIKLVLLIPTLDRSGAEKQLTLLATRLPREEFDVQVIALTRGGPYEQTLRDHDVPTMVLGKRWKFDPRALFRLHGELRRLSPDVVHTWLFAANAYGRLMGVSRRRWRTIVSERCVDTWKAPWQHWLDRRLIARTDRLVANSQSTADFYRRLGFPDERLTVINNGIELPPAPARDRAQLLGDLKLPRDAKLVGHVGRLAKQKRVDDLLWAAQVLRQAEPRAYFLVIGEGPEEARLKQHARNIECVEHVRFMGHHSDAAEMVSLLDVYWLGSDFEGMSNSLMEAMAAGVPVVVTDIPPNRELVTHGEHGYVVSVGDGVGFAQFTVRLLEDDALAQRLGAAGRRTMRENFSAQRMVDAHAALYREVCAKPQADAVTSLNL